MGLDRAKSNWILGLLAVQYSIGITGLHVDILGPPLHIIKVSGTSALLSFGAISSTVHPHFPVWYAE